MRPTVIRAMRSTVPWRSTRRWPATTAAQVLVVLPGGPAKRAGVGSPVLATHAQWPQKEGERGGQMTSQQPGLAGSSEPGEEDGVHRASAASRSMGELPNSVAGQFDFWDNRYEGRRLFSEVLGTFFLVLVAVGGGMVNARFGGHEIPLFVQVTAPALMVGAIILFMGTVSGAHLNPGVSIAFALRGDYPWRRVPASIVAQFLGVHRAHVALGERDRSPAKGAHRP